MGLSIQHEISGCLEETIGAAGLSALEFSNWVGRACDGAHRLAGLYEDSSLPLLRISEERDDIELAKSHYYQLIEGAETVVFLGTGGSSLGGQTIAQIGGWFIPGDAVKSPRNLPRTRIFDNLDPRSLERGIALLNLEKSRFVVISKSGNTAETLLQTISVIDAFRKAGLEDKIGASFLGISQIRQAGAGNGLRDLLEPYGSPFLDHELEIGGRFACLTNVGLILAIARGLDPFALRAGANEVIRQLVSSANYDEFMPVLGAAASIGLYQERNIFNVVMMPYADKLARFAHWYAQLWAESLGKEGAGTTPIAALGPVDQHSQLQLYMDGPVDKLITIVATETQGCGASMPAGLATKAGIDYMARRTVGDLVAAQVGATVEALQKAGRPTRFIRVPAINEHVLGQLLMSFMIETILAADLLGINAFDQPAVEIGKGIARDRLTRDLL